jgi:nicotinate-nucleotide pyrophosphorylase (carboxylating)
MQGGRNSVLPDKEHIRADVRRALNEDLGIGDVTAALLPSDKTANAVIISREPMLVCGRPWVAQAFAELDPDIRLEWLVKEGEWLDNPSALCRIYGNARSILSVERTALNFLQTLSGTATQTRQYVQALEGYSTRLLDTRKTLPGLRLAQKYAVACAGGTNHRLGLYDAFLIKENHIRACGSIRGAIERARQGAPELMLEIEVETLDEFREALECKPDRIMLDNFNLEMIEEAVALNQHCCELEVSGGIDLTTIRRVAKTGVDFISVGAITKSVRAIDLSLLIDKPE